MAESKYKTSKIVRKQSNRHMVKCYPSWQESHDKLSEFQLKLKFTKNEAENQGKIIDWMFDESVKYYKQRPEKLNYEALKIPGGLLGYKTYNFENDKRLQINSGIPQNSQRLLKYQKISSNKNASSRDVSEHKIKKAQELYESSLYINNNIEK